MISVSESVGPFKFTETAIGSSSEDKLLALMAFSVVIIVAAVVLTRFSR